MIAAINFLLIFATGAAVIQAQAAGRSGLVAGGLAVLCWGFIDLCLFRLERLRRQRARREEEERQRQAEAGEFYGVVKRGHLPSAEEKTAAVKDGAGSDEPGSDET